MQREARYIRDVDADGQTIQVPVDIEPFLKTGVLRSVDMMDEEFDQFLHFSGDLGDGEAMSLAVARHRSWVLATDDGKAMKMAKDVGVETISTPEIIKAWAELNADNLRNLASVLKRIEKRAHFKPPRSSSLFDWWNNYSSG